MAGIEAPFADAVGPSGRAPACLLILCGLPGAGKTSLASLIAEEAFAQGVHVANVCFDQLGCQPSDAGGGGEGSGSTPEFTPDAWQAAREAALSVLRIDLGGHCTSDEQQEGAAASRAVGGKLRVAAAPPPRPQPEQEHQHEQQWQHRLVIADDNMQYRSMRGRCYSLARATGAAAVLLHVRCREALALQRNAARPAGARVPAGVISRMAAVFEEPGRAGSDAGGGSSAWEASCLVECNGEAPVDAVALWRQVWQRWGQPAPPPHDAEAAAAARATAQAATAANLTHAADVVTRHVLTECMQRLAAAGPRAKAAAALQLNAARRQLLQDLHVHAEAGEHAAPGAGLPTQHAEAAADRCAAVYRQRCETILAALASPEQP